MLTKSLNKSKKRNVPESWLFTLREFSLRSFCFHFVHITFFLFLQQKIYRLVWLFEITILSYEDVGKFPDNNKKAE